MPRTPINLSRRNVLQASGAAMTGGMLSTASAAAEEDDDGFQFDEVVNMVDAGADPTGEEPVDPLIHEHAADNTLLYFPEGRYKLDQYRNYEGPDGTYEGRSAYYELTNFGIVGEGSDKVTLVPPDGRGSGKFGDSFWDQLWFEIRFGENILFEGFTFDATAENTGPRFQLITDGDFELRDVKIEGTYDVGRAAIVLLAFDEDAETYVENVRMPDGATANRATGLFLHSAHQGREATFKNLHIEGFADNGLYASKQSDRQAVRVYGGYFANNNGSNVRLGSKRSFVKNATIAVTEKVHDFDRINMRGVSVIRGGGVTIESCDILYSADARSFGAVTVGTLTGGATIKNTRIQVDAPAETPAITALWPEWDHLGDEIEIKNVHITGDAVEGYAIDVWERSQCTIENTCIDQTAGDRGGVRFTESNGTITNSVIKSGGDRITSVDSDVTTENLRESGDCAPTVTRGIEESSD